MSNNTIDYESIVPTYRNDGATERDGPPQEPKISSDANPMSHLESNMIDESVLKPPVTNVVKHSKRSRVGFSKQINFDQTIPNQGLDKYSLLMRYHSESDEGKTFRSFDDEDLGNKTQPLPLRRSKTIAPSGLRKK